MNHTKELLSAVLPAALVAGVIATAGTATAAARGDVPRPGDNVNIDRNDQVHRSNRVTRVHRSTRNITKAVVHSAGSGGTVVGVAGAPGANVTQEIDQHKNDDSMHRRLVDNSHTSSRTLSHSNNALTRRDRHDADIRPR